ncbi:MAG: hypothetical protein V2I40_04615, partial [Desulfobacteraceae bacterium]|nr:hypothetical protein [Desulfobacteraceae bacterium]
MLFLISCRPGQLAFDDRQIANPYYSVQSIQLNDLSPENSEALVKSLLQSVRVPPVLSAFITDRLGGNPFFLEEVINSLVDTGVLKKSGPDWKVSGTIVDTFFSSSISSVIAARLDRLGTTAKRIVQEAAVIDRRFSPATLKRIASDPESVYPSLA